MPAFAGMTNSTYFSGSATASFAGMTKLQRYDMIYFSYKITRTMVICFIMIMLNLNCKSNGSEPIDDGPNGNDTIPEVSGWTLIWNDEFGGTEIDRKKWEHEANAWGGGNNELQYYTDRDVNSYIEDGKLVIQGLKETYTGPEGTREYTSARLRTLNKGDWKYGRFEVKALLPYGQGIWPAIWMLPTDWVYGGWPASGEIDIVEMVGHDTKTVHGTLHYGGAWPDNVQSGDSFTLEEGTFSNDFHVFTIEWEADEIRWYVDGIHYQTQNQWYSSEHGFPAPFDQRFHLLLNLAIGGNWPGNPDETTVFPQKMFVDYVRVYEKNVE